MKPEIDSTEKLHAWAQQPKPAVFQGLDLTQHEENFSKVDISGCVFLGCEMGVGTRNLAALYKCLVVPRFPNQPFNAFEPGLYSPDELYNNYDPNNSLNSYENCLDRKIYLSFIDPKTKKQIPSDVDVTIARRIHDASIADALDDFLDIQR